MAEKMYCETEGCGVIIEGKGKGSRFCAACIAKRRRERNRRAMQLRREQERLGAVGRYMAAANLAPPKLTIADIAIYAKEHGITYGKAVMELEGRRRK